MPLTNLDPSDLFPAVETKLDAAIDKVNEIDANLPGGTTGQALKKVNGTDYNYDWSDDISDGVRETSSSAVLKTKVLQIGDWNMDSTDLKDVAHGIADSTKIRGVLSILIRHDTTTQILPLDYGNRVDSGGSLAALVSGNYEILATGSSIRLRRHTGTIFDSTSYDATGYNRGWVTIIYEV